MSIQPQSDAPPTCFHGTALTIVWFAVIDLACFASAFRWFRYSYYIHVFLGLVVIGLTLAASIPQLQFNFLVDPNQPSLLVNVHRVVGFIVCVWLGLQMICGVFGRFTQFSPKTSPTFNIYAKRFHFISGYIIMLAAKFDYLNANFDPGYVTIPPFIGFLCGQIGLLAIYLWLKFGYWTLSEQIVDPQVKGKGKSIKIQQLKKYNDDLLTDQSKTVSSKSKKIPIQLQTTMVTDLQEEHELQQKLKVPQIKQFEFYYTTDSEIQLESYVLFNDFVYDTSKMHELHPGGQYIMKITNKREIDRFLYGCYTTQLTPTLKRHSHTRESMRLIGPPIARINRRIPIIGLQNFNKVVLKEIAPIQKNSSTFLIKLKLKNKRRIQFLGMQSESEIGQYFTLTISNSRGWNRVTRLYTTIWCIRSQNVQRMKTFFPNLDDISSIQNSNENSEQIPIVLKRYEKGELTPRLLNQEFNGQIVLSKPMGAGMSYQTLQQSGRVIIVCGGTGLLPFCDFIDVLFKRVKVLENDKMASNLIQFDPIINHDLIKSREFIIYCAAQSKNDFLELSLNQINYLCGSDSIKFKSIFRIKKDQQTFQKAYKNISLQKDYFTNNIINELKIGQINKIYICGSPQMNASIGKILQQNLISQNLYHFM